MSQELISTWLGLEPGEWPPNHYRLLGLKPGESDANVIEERVHQHLDIGQGDVDWDVFFRALAEVEFDGIATVCVFAWEERARESSAYNLEQIRQYLAKHGGRPA